MGELLDTAKDLGNTWSPQWNAVKNFVSDKILGQPQVKAFNATKEAVGSEVLKAYQGGHITDAQMDHFTKGLDSSGSPEQLVGVMNEFHGLMLARQNVMLHDYKQIMGKDAPFTPTTEYDTKIKQYYADKLKSSQPSQPAAQPDAAPAATQAPQAGSMYKGWRFKGGNPADQNNWEKP
jgi:hypothetical protein